MNLEEIRDLAQKRGLKPVKLNKRELIRFI